MSPNPDDMPTHPEQAIQYALYLWERVAVALERIADGMDGEVEMRVKDD